MRPNIQKTVIVSSAHIIRHVLDYIDEPNVWCADGVGLKGECGGLGANRQLIMEVEGSDERIKLGVQLQIDVKGFKALTGYGRTGDTLANYFVFARANDKVAAYPIKLIINTPSDRTVKYKDDAMFDRGQDEEGCIGITELNARVLVRVLQATDFPQLFKRLNAHLYGTGGICLSTIIEHIEATPKVWSCETGKAVLFCHQNADWMIDWTFKNDTWVRDFGHYVKIDTSRFARHANEPILSILDRLIEIPVSKLAITDDHHARMIRAIAKDSLNSTYDD